MRAAARTARDRRRQTLAPGALAALRGIRRPRRRRDAAAFLARPTADGETTDVPRSVVGLLSDIDSAGDIAPVGELPARVAGAIGQATPQRTDGQPSGPCDGIATVPTALTDGLDIAAALRHVRPTVLSPWSEARNPNPMATPTTLTRITFDPDVMGGKACIRGLRVTVGTIIGLLAAGRSPNEIVQAYPYLEREDIDEALAYAAWRLEEREVPLAGAWRSSS